MELAKVAERVEEPNERELECHDVPFSPPVMAFYPGSPLREAFAQWWRPEFSGLERRKRFEAAMAAGEGWDLASDDGLTHLYAVLRDHHIRCDGMRFLSPRMTSEVDPTEQMEQESDPVVKMRVHVRIDYPLVNPVERSFDVELHRLGEIFGFAHDLYREVYDADAALRGGKPAPRVGNGCMNRQRTELVWGHDFGDLAYESLHFSPPSDQERADGLLGYVEFGIGS